MLTVFCDCLRVFIITCDCLPVFYPHMCFGADLLTLFCDCLRDFILTRVSELTCLRCLVQFVGNAVTDFPPCQIKVWTLFRTQLRYQHVSGIIL